MVQILPQKTNLGSLIGQSLGSGLQEGLQSVVKQNYQRNQLQQAMEEASKTNDPIAKSLALLKGGIGNPDAYRAIAGLLPLIQTQTQGQNLPVLPGQSTPNLPGQGGMPPQGGMSQQLPSAGQGMPSQQQYQPLTQGQSPQQQQGAPTQQMPNATQGMQPQGEQPSQQGTRLGDFIPLDLSRQLTGAQRSQIIKDSIARGGDANLTRDYLNDYEKGNIDFNTLQNQNVNKAYADVERKREFQDSIAGFLDTQLDPKTSPGDKNVAYSMISEAYPNGNVDIRNAWRKIEPKYNSYKRETSAFENSIPKVDMSEGNLGFFPEDEKKWKDKGESIIKKYPGAYPVLLDFFTNKGHNPIAASRALNPLPAQIESTINKSKDYRQIMYPRWDRGIEEGGGIGTKERNGVNEGIAEQNRDIPKMSVELASKWNPNISLLGLYGDLRQQGWAPNSVHELFSTIRKQLPTNNQFSPQQEEEANMVLNNPPIPLGSRKVFRKQ